MKYLLFIILIIPSISNAQSPLPAVDYLRSFHTYTFTPGTINSETSKVDTIPCIMIVSDTAHFKCEEVKPGGFFWPVEAQYDSIKYEGGPVFAMRGYMVKSPIEYTFLDINKNPLKLFVWMSYNLNKIQ